MDATYAPIARECRSGRTRKAARDRWSVGRWKQERFVSLYPGFGVDVLDGDGEIVEFGQTLLETVRESYD